MAAAGGEAGDGGAMPGSSSPPTQMKSGPSKSGFGAMTTSTPTEAEDAKDKRRAKTAVSSSAMHSQKTRDSSHANNATETVDTSLKNLTNTASIGNGSGGSMKARKVRKQGKMVRTASSTSTRSKPKGGNKTVTTRQSRDSTVGTVTGTGISTIGRASESEMEHESGPSAVFGVIRGICNVPDCKCKGYRLHIRLLLVFVHIFLRATRK